MPYHACQFSVRDILRIVMIADVTAPTRGVTYRMYDKAKYTYKIPETSVLWYYKSQWGPDRRETLSKTKKDWRHHDNINFGSRNEGRTIAAPFPVKIPAVFDRCRNIQVEAVRVEVFRTGTPTVHSYAGQGIG
ncbi:hypothetical protein RvY_13432 [Ramazzottius varieornatus]|uniref:Uncharacterized protein n=1 Tax=Ramazzottius varieornatus TaxID=947166 RepID=A0A1D1VWD8_RAMVA|nr:hypothetical protein RvY_13432 [Ramazzottius varieornatus]